MGMLLGLVPGLGWLWAGIRAFLGTELGRAALVALVAFTAGHWRASTKERAACQARVEESRAQAAAIDRSAEQEAIARAQRQVTESEARAKAAERYLKELANEFENKCTLSGADAERLNRLPNGGASNGQSKPAPSIRRR